MNKSRRIALSAAIFVCYASLAEDAASRARFDGDAIVRVYVSDDAQLASLLDMTDDVWSHGVGLGPVDVRLSVASQVAIELLGWDYDVLIPDLQSLIDDRGGQSDATAGVSSVFDNFQPLSVVDAHLLALENLRPDLAERVQIGTSLRGRPMYVVRISGPGDTADRPDIFIHGGIHAREWITVTTVLYLADRLVHDYDSDSYVRRLVNQANWYIMPVYNPDGYDYSWTNNRLWRKNRRSSFGVDLNRNYDANWGGVGSSGSPNDQTYRGAAPFSEPETQAVRDFVLGLPNFAGYFDVHSYSQLLMWPWGPTPALPEDNLEFEILGQEMVRLIQDVHGRTYAPGPIYTTIYPVSGGSIDWVYQDTGVLAMTFELRDTGEAGFLLPPNQILPNAEEAFPALLHYADHVSAPIRITYPNGVPASVGPGGSSVVVEIGLGQQGGAIETARALIRISPDEEFAAQSLISLNEGRYEIVLPASSCGSTIEFFVEAIRDDGLTISELDSIVGGTHKVLVGQREVVSSSDFETAQGWNWAGFIPPSGRWRVGTPTGTFDNGVAAEPKGGNPFGSGGSCWSTQPSLDNDPESSDVDGGPTVLFGAYYDVSAMNDPIFGYYRWHYSSGYVTFDVTATGSDGTRRVVETAGSASAWEYAEFRVQDIFPEGTNGFRLEVSIQDLDGANSITESAFDDFVLYDVVCSQLLPGDLNCDGVLSVGDIGPFVLAITNPADYAAQYPDCEINHADVNEDGAISVSDIGPFVALVTGG